MNMYATNSAKPFMWVSYWFLRIVYEGNTKYNYAHFIDQQTEALIKCFALGNAATELLSPVLNQSLSETQTYALKHNTFLSCTFWFLLYISNGFAFITLFLVFHFSLREIVWIVKTELKQMVHACIILRYPSTNIRLHFAHFI